MTPASSQSSHAARRLIARSDHGRQVLVTFALAVAGALAGMVGALGIHGL